MLFYIIPEIRYAIGLAEQLKDEMMIITSHSHPALAMLRAQGIRVWCAEEEGIEPPYHAHGLLLLPKVRELVEAWPLGQRYFVTFKNSPPFTLQVKKLKAKLLMPSFKLNRFWEDKNRGLSKLVESNLAIKPAFSGTWKGFSYEDVVSRFNHDKLVVQKPFGMAGNSTFFVNSAAEWEELSKKIGEDPLVKITPFLEGEPFTVNCLLLPSGEVKTSYPMLQITGDKRFTRYAGGTCGIDMTGSRTFSSKFLKELAAAMETMGAVMLASKFWGWFGVDILISNGEFVILEINPRFTASISLFSQAQSIHCGHSFWQEYFEGSKGNWQSQVPLPYTSLILRNITDQDVIVVKDMLPGIYKLNADKLEFIKETVFVKDLVLPQTYLITTKKAGTNVHADGELATILAYGSATTQGNIDDNLAKVADLVKITALGKS